MVKSEKINSRNFDNVLNTLINQIPEEIIEMDNINNKLDYMLLTNGWNDKNERIIISIGENAASYKWMHEKSAARYKLINQIFSIIMIVFSTGLSAEIIIPAENNLILDIFRKIFTFVITLFSVLQNFLKYEKLAEQHLSSANSFGQLYHGIQQQMCMYRKDRTLAITYVTDTLKQYDNLIVNGPRIVSTIIHNFKNTFKNAEISVPDIADRIQKIEIVSEQPHTLNSTKTKNYETFQIRGDISEQDLENCTETEYNHFKNKFVT